MRLLTYNRQYPHVMLSADLNPEGTTRTAATHRLHGHVLRQGQELASPESGLRYRVGEFLGQGGFGQVFRATRLGRSTRIPVNVCIKISARLDGWVREAYFGLILKDHPRAIQVYDRFPLADEGRLFYCLVLECAEHGDLSGYLALRSVPWRESTARREIAGVLDVLGRLHRGQQLHRDLTPMNLFVCKDRRLKLGDFGIVSQQSDTRGVTARTMNAFTAPVEILMGDVPKWQARDDVYQVGQVLGMLVRGDARTRLQRQDVRRLACSDQLKEIIYRCLGERRKRYDTADELIEALRMPPADLRAGRLNTLKGMRIAFTGFLTRPRREALLAAKRAGAIVQSAPSATTNVLVRGRPNKLQAAGADGGVKLLEVKRLRERGHRITIISEDRFWVLAAKGA